MRTRIYYRGPDAVVTSELFVWRTSPPKAFAIRDLRDVGIVRTDDRDPRTTRAAAGSTALALSLWPVMDSPAVLTAVVLAVAAPGVALVAHWCRRPRRWELHATYRGSETLLYASPDDRVFNQVARALRRAMEDAESDPPWDTVVAA